VTVQDVCSCPGGRPTSSGITKRPPAAHDEGPWLVPLRPVMVAFLALLATACVSVPQEAVVLSNLVGAQIAEHRASHEAFVRRYYGRSRDVVEIFLRDRWVPEYMDRFMALSGVMDLVTTPEEVFGQEKMARLEEELLAVPGIGEVRAPLVMEAVARVFGHEERGQILLDFAQVALAEIEAQRAELLEPLNRQEREVLEHLDRSYAQLQQAQGQVTAYLASARDVTRSQDEILDAMGMRQPRDDALERIVRLSEDLAAAAIAGESALEALEKMKALIESFGSAGSGRSEESRDRTEG
jgi:hypothetical protein